MKRNVLSILVLVALVVVALSAHPIKAQTATKVRLQLKWVDQAQFAGIVFSQRL